MAHLQFVDYTILFSRAYLKELQTLKIVLFVFRQIFGLKVNLGKSTLSGINITQVQLTRLALLLDCKALD